MRRLFDEKCLLLAHNFMDDHPHLRPLVDDLSRTIQTAIDEWLEDAEERRRIIIDQIRLLTDA